METEKAPSVAPPDEMSRRLLEEARRVIPGGVNSPVRAFKGVGGTPRFIRSAEGSTMEDVDGRTYLDYVGSWGVMLLGHGHPDVVRADEEYNLQLTISNTSNAPANLVSIRLPGSKLIGTELVDPAAYQQTIDSLLPGDSEVLTFRLRSRITGRIVSTSARGDRLQDCTAARRLGPRKFACAGSRGRVGAQGAALGGG